MQFPSGTRFANARRAMIIFDGSRYRVRFNRVHHGPTAVVAFSCADAQPGLDKPFWGEDFLRDRGFNAIGITAACNDWYAHPEIEAALAAIRAAAGGLRLVGYGGSMGGYGAINHAEALDLGWVVAVAPQFSPFEKRFAHLQTDSEFPLHRLDRLARRVLGYVIYDPQMTQDRRQAELILAHHDLAPLLVPLGGHGPMKVLQDAGILEEAVLAMLRGSHDAAFLRRRLRARRGTAARYLWQMGFRMYERNLPLRALEMFARAHAAASPPQFDIDEAYARTLIFTGRSAAEVAAVLLPWADHPEHGMAARALLKTLRQALAA